MKKLLTKFISRWIVSGLGLWIAASLLGSARLSLGNGQLKTVIVAGFFLAVVNMFLKPVLVVLAFPAIILSLGLFMLVLNGILILIASWLYNPLHVSSIWVAIVAGLIIGLVNFLVSRVLEDI